MLPIFSRFPHKYFPPTILKNNLEAFADTAWSSKIQTNTCCIFHAVD